MDGPARRESSDEAVVVDGVAVVEGSDDPSPRPLSRRRGEGRIGLRCRGRLGEGRIGIGFVFWKRHGAKLGFFDLLAEEKVALVFFLKVFSESSHVAAIGPARLGEFVSLLTVATFTEIEADDLLVLGVKEILAKIADRSVGLRIDADEIDLLRVACAVELKVQHGWDGNDAGHPFKRSPSVSRMRL